MGKSRKACIAGVCILLAVVAVASFFIGYKVAVDIASGISADTGSNIHCHFIAYEK